MQLPQFIYCILESRHAHEQEEFDSSTITTTCKKERYESHKTLRNVLAIIRVTDPQIFSYEAETRSMNAIQAQCKTEF